MLGALDASSLLVPFAAVHNDLGRVSGALGVVGLFHALASGPLRRALASSPAALQLVAYGMRRKPLRIATFDVDATPPVGTNLAFKRVANTWQLGLRARGIVLVGAGKPIVLCAVDWLGIANEGHDAFCAALAAAARTTPERVAVHTVHQHDAPDCDFGAEEILRHAGLDPLAFESGFQRDTLRRLEVAVRESLTDTRAVTHLGLGEARVTAVASNRRILGPDGKVRAVRYTACPDPALRAQPEGTIDPVLSLVSFWDGDRPLAALSYYATHPQSYYGTGVPNPDFPGIARFLRELEVPEALHVHFNGAAGNVGAGKYNDGSPATRHVLARRLADGMQLAWETSERSPIAAEDVHWSVQSVALPPARHLDAAKLAATKGRDRAFLARGGASQLAWSRRAEAGRRIDVGCLALGRARVLHMPGELFVEYQLAAKATSPDRFVAMAAYGDYGPRYVGTARSYTEGGYETEPRSSNVAPEVEGVLMTAIETLLASADAHAGLVRSAPHPHV
jgi:hypothetical protein